MMGARRIVGYWAETLERFSSLDSTSAQLSSQVRAQQVNSIARTTLPMMAGNLCLGAMLVYFSLPTPTAVLSLIWFAVLSTVCGLALRSWVKSRRMPVHKHASQRAVSRAALHAGSLGLLWGAAPALFFSFEFSELSAALALGLTGLICAAGFVLAPIPQAVLAFLAPVTAGALSVLLLHPTAFSGTLAFMLVGYAAIVLSASYSQNRIYLRAMLVSATVEEQKKTISLLLKDFEAHSSDWLWETDENLKLIRASERFAQAAGRAQLELAGIGLLDLLCASDPDAHPAIGVILNAMERHQNFTEIEVPVVINAESHWWSLTGMAEVGANGAFIGYHGVGSDITFEKKADERISFLAHNDALTGLLNRAHFTEMLGQTVSRLERYGSPFALMFLDLDHFKTVNDTRGHPVGDRLLIDVSKRLRALVPRAPFLRGWAAMSLRSFSTRPPKRRMRSRWRRQLFLLFPSHLSLMGRPSISAPASASPSRRATARAPISCCATWTLPCTAPKTAAVRRTGFSRSAWTARRASAARWSLI